ncbi:MAG TPA: phosphotransferase [Cyclobacteriaceae bacterium]|nr:phosphotransferase [Cyclobacteriaceae bacterium]
MNREQIDRLAAHGKFQEQTISGQVIETHISWVIVYKDYAVKIKKPVKLSFVDFSTIALRRKYCQLELRLNRRWSDIYLFVCPIHYQDGGYSLDAKKGRIIDYAVVMKRVPEDLRMDRQLRKGNVSLDHIIALARTIAAVHTTSKVIRRRFSLAHEKKLFNDIQHYVIAAGNIIDPGMKSLARTAVSWSDQFLERHKDRFNERVAAGFQRDVHGDLHSANVFITPSPVIFDCIEFNSRYRQIDILYDVAFLVMDLEAFGYFELAKVFFDEYMRRIQCVTTPEDHELFLYFKGLRANVRAKVQLIQALQSTGEAEIKFHAGEAATYLTLMSRYISTK